MDPVTLAALFGAGATLGQGALNWFSQNGINNQNYQIHQENLAWSRQSQLLAQRYNTQMWQMNNQWNSPANQMALLRGAGLNPNLAYGNAFGNASAPQINSQTTSEGNPMQAPQMSGLESIFGNFLQAKQLKQNQELVDSEVKLNETKAEEQRINNETLSERNKLSIEEIQKRNKLVDTNIEVAKENLDLLKYQKGIAAEQHRQAIVQTIFDESTLEYRIQLVSQQYELNEQSKEYLRLLCKEVNSKIKLNNSLSAMYGELKKLLQTQNEYLPEKLRAENYKLWNEGDKEKALTKQIYNNIHWDNVLNPLKSQTLGRQLEHLSFEENMQIFNAFISLYTQSMQNLKSAVSMGMTGGLSF